MGNERQQPRLAAPRWQQPHLRTGGGRDCEAEIWRSRSGAKSKRIAWWERRGSGGLREQEASRRSGVQLPAAICASTRRGKRERNGKGEGWTCGPVAKYTEKPAERPASIKKSAFGTTLSRSRGSYKSAERPRATPQDYKLLKQRRARASTSPVEHCPNINSPFELRGQVCTFFAWADLMTG